MCSYLSIIDHIFCRPRGNNYFSNWPPWAVWELSQFQIRKVFFITSRYVWRILSTTVAKSRKHNHGCWFRFFKVILFFLFFYPHRLVVSRRAGGWIQPICPVENHLSVEVYALDFHLTWHIHCTNHYISVSYYFLLWTTKHLTTFCNQRLLMNEKTKFFF